jgi:hypothetical protein
VSKVLGSPVTKTTLWILGKDDQTIRCFISGEPGHEELQVVIDDEPYISEVHTVHGGAVGRAETLRRGYEARGWTPVSA